MQRPLILQYHQRDRALSTGAEAAVPFGYLHKDVQLSPRVFHKSRRRQRKALPSMVRSVEEPLRLRVGSQSMRWSHDGNTVRSPQSAYDSLPSLQGIRNDEEDNEASLSYSARASCDNGPDQRHQPYQVSNRRSRSHQRIFLGERSRGPYESGRALDSPRPEQSLEVIRKSTPELWHPQPSRLDQPRWFINFESQGVEDTDSMVANTGRAIKPTKQAEEEDSLWKSWLDINSDKCTHNTPLHNTDTSEAETLTPGVSHVWPDTSSPSPSTHDDCRSKPSELSNIGSPVLDNTEALQDQREQGFAWLVSSPVGHRPFAKSHSPDQGAIRLNNSTARLNKHDSTDPGTSDSARGSVSHLDLAPICTLPPSPDIQGSGTGKVPDHLICKTVVQAKGDEESFTLLDEDEVWKKFVFGGHEADIKRRAYEEARVKTRQQLLQPPTPVASVTVEALSSTSPEVLFYTHAHAPDIVSHCPRSSSPLRATAPATTTASTISATPTDTPTSLAVEHGSPCIDKETSAEHRFHHPAPFIGRLASSSSTTVHCSTLAPPRRQSKGRPLQRDTSRPDFRAFPNFEGDPIESEDE